MICGNSHFSSLEFRATQRESFVFGHFFRFDILVLPYIFINAYPFFRQFFSLRRFQIICRFCPMWKMRCVYICAVVSYDNQVKDHVSLIPNEMWLAFTAPIFLAQHYPNDNFGHSSTRQISNRKHRIEMIARLKILTLLICILFRLAFFFISWVCWIPAFAVR